MSLKDTLVKNALWLLSGDVAEKVLSYFLIVALARQLGAVGLGEYSFVYAFVGLTFLLADFGVGYYLLREASRSKKGVQEIFSNSLSLKLMLIALAFSATILFIMKLSKTDQVLYSIIVLCGILSLQHIGNLFESIFQARNKMHLVSAAKIFERLLAFSMGLYVLLTFKNLFLFFMALFAAYFFKVIYQAYYGSKFVNIIPRFNWNVMKHILKSSIPLWLTGVFAFIYFRIDIVMLSLMVNDQVVGWYSAAYKLIDALNFIPYLVFVSSFPSMSLLFEKNKKFLAALLQRVIRYLIFLAIPMIVGTILLAERLLQFIYGSEFANSVIVLKILIFAEALVFITYILGTSLNAMNKEKYFTMMLVSLAGVNVILNFILIPRFTYVGAAAATVATEFISLVVLTILMKKFLVRIRFEILKPLIASAIMGLTIYYLRSFAIWWLILIGFCTYSIGLYLLGLKKEDKELLNHLMRKVISY